MLAAAQQVSARVSVQRVQHVQRKEGHFHFCAPLEHPGQQASAWLRCVCRLHRRHAVDNYGMQPVGSASFASLPATTSKSHDASRCTGLACQLTSLRHSARNAPGLLSTEPAQTSELHAASLLTAICTACQLTSLRRSSPSASSTARPCASVDTPSSSSPPSTITLPLVPATCARKYVRCCTAVSRCTRPLIGRQLWTDSSSHEGEDVKPQLTCPARLCQHAR